MNYSNLSTDLTEFDPWNEGYGKIDGGGYGYGFGHGQFSIFGGGFGSGDLFYVNILLYGYGDGGQEWNSGEDLQRPDLEVEANKWVLDYYQLPI
jgi:hypothetical protein